MSLVVHAAVLYGSAAAAIVAALATRRRAGDPAPSPGRIAVTLSPFLIIGLLEALSLCAEGHLLAEWSVPLLAATAVAVGSRDRRVIRVAGGLLMLVALGAWVHGRSLLHRGYVIRPHMAIRGGHLEKG
jgi:hypothetical protein